MLHINKHEFCTECRKETEYYLKKIPIEKNIRGKTYNFDVTTAICKDCRAIMGLPGIIDLNVKEIDEQYRAAEEIVSSEDINRLMRLYDIGKDPLSLALGFGQVTIGRYMKGQVPSKDHSDTIRRALSSPAFMRQMLEANREKLTNTAYKKAMGSVESIEKLFSVSEKMLRVIAYLFHCLKEITPLALQKLLYYIQGIHHAIHGRFIFEEDCQAWAHGPVYTEVYDIFRSFSFNPIEDARFAILDGAGNALTPEEQQIGNKPNIWERLVNGNSALKKFAKSVMMKAGMKKLYNSAFKATYKTVWCAGVSIEHVHKVRPIREIIADLTE